MHVHFLFHLAHVGVHVVLQLISLSKCLEARATLKPVVGRVHVAVLQQFPCLPKRLGALEALKWLADVESPVPCPRHFVLEKHEAMPAPEHGSPPPVA